MKALKVLNNQPSEEVNRNPEGKLDVVSVFRTIQGEGPFAGRPCVFVRLAGCNLRCPACDTDYTTGRRTVLPEDLIKEVEDLNPNGLVVITGGEPFRQRLSPFIEMALLKYCEVQVETNGRLFDPEVIDLSNLWASYLTIVCSPKGGINPSWYPHLRHFKYVLRSGEVAVDDGLPTSSLGYTFYPQRPWKEFKGTVWVQPMDSQSPEENALNIAAAVASCLKYGYRLSLQTHKIIGLP